MVFKKIFSARNSNSFNTLFIDDQSPIRKGRQLWGNFRRRFRSEAAAKNATFFFACDIFKWDNGCHSASRSRNNRIYNKAENSNASQIEYLG